METNWTTALKESISEVFSTMFFLVVSEEPSLLSEVAGRPASGWLEGWLEVSKHPQSVRIWVWAPHEVAAELGANLMSLEPTDLGPEGLLDAYREMMNMVAGKVLTLVDRDGSWKMGLPNAAILQSGNVGEASAKAGQRFTYDSEDRPVVVGLTTIGD